MPLPDRDHVVDQLPEMEEFRPGILAAWKKWEDLDPELKVEITDTVRAGMVHCFIVTEMSKRLGGVAEIIDLTGLKVFLIRDYAIRFKKHDQDLVSKNQRTGQVKKFMGQLPLSGLPACHKLEVGYVLDLLGLQIASTNLVCPNGYKNVPMWSIELHDGGFELPEIQDLFGPDNPRGDGVDQNDHGAKWKRRESGVIIPFNRSKRSDD